MSSLQSLISELSQPLKESSICETRPVLKLIGAAVPCLWSNEVSVVPLSKVPYLNNILEYVYIADYPFRIQTYCHHVNNTEVG